MPSRRPANRIASDGLRARENGAWAVEKLSFLDRFVPPALSITMRKTERVYVDLFAGPGRNVVPDSGREIEGSAIRVLQLRGQGRGGPPFSHAHIVNLVGLDADPVEERTERLYAAKAGLVPRPNVHIHRGDANVLLSEIMASIHPRAYVFVFADIEGTKQWPWSSVASLKARGHESVDLYMLFPLDMAINRLIAVSSPGHTERHARLLTDFYGTDEWRSLCARRITDAQSPAVRQGLVDLYLSQLRRHWPYAAPVKEVRSKGDRRLYLMLFATKDDAAQRVAEWVRDGGRGDSQLGLDGFL